MPRRPQIAELASLSLVAGLLPEFVLVFDHRYYFFTNRSAFPSDQEIPSRAALMRDFVERGMPGGFNYSDGEAIDPDFYAETYGLALDRSRAVLMRHWMTEGIALGLSPNVDHWLERKGISVFGRLQTVRNIDLVRAAAPYRGEAAATTTWAEAAEHLLSGLRIDLAIFDPLRPQGAWLLLAAAIDLDRRGKHQAAYILMEYLCGHPSVACEARVAYAQQLRHRGHPLVALTLLDSVVNGPRPSEAAYLFLSECLADLERFEEAMTTAFKGHHRWPADPGLKSRARQAAATYESDAIRRASAALLFDRGQANQLISAMWSKLQNALAPEEYAAKRGGRRVAVLANLDLPQCRFYRVEQKTRQLDHLGYCNAVYNKNTDYGALTADLERYDFLIIYRVAASVELLRVVSAAKNLGLQIIYEVDDLIFDTSAFPPLIETYDGLISASAYRALQLEAMLSRATLQISEAGIASTDALAEAMRPHLSEVFVHRNGYDDRHLEAVAAAHPVSAAVSTVVPTTLFYGSGSLAHRRDATDLLSVYLCRLAEREETRAILVSTGPLSSSPGKAGSVVEVAGHRSLRAFWSELAAMDVNLAPLVSSPLTDAKSEIKWLEAALFGVPSVVGRTDTYTRVIRDGVDGVVAETPSEWADAIENLVSRPEERRRMGENARERVLRDYGVEALAAPLDRFLSGLSKDRQNLRPLIMGGQYLLPTGPYRRRHACCIGQYF